jgi:hypothetical protein
MVDCAAANCNNQGRCGGMHAPHDLSRTRRASPDMPKIERIEIKSYECVVSPEQS